MRGVKKGSGQLGSFRCLEAVSGGSASIKRLQDLELTSICACVDVDVAGVRGPWAACKSTTNGHRVRSIWLDEALLYEVGVQGLLANILLDEVVSIRPLPVRSREQIRIVLLLQR